jgi:hypothetical protein
MSNAVDVIKDYREQKKKLDQLAAAARRQMQARYLDLLTEAAEVQGEFKSAFGTNPDLPATVKTFTVGENKKPAATDAQATGKKIGTAPQPQRAIKKMTRRAIELTGNWKRSAFPLPADTVPAGAH